jgi:hypothetical protein
MGFPEARGGALLKKRLLQPEETKKPSWKMIMP